MTVTNYETLDLAVKSEIFGSYSDTAIFFENQVVKPKSLKELIKVFIVIPTSDKESVTTSDSIDSGAIMVQIFTELNKGLNRSNELMGIIKALLVDKEVGSGSLFINSVRPIPAPPDKRYYQKNLEARFIFSYHN